MDMDVVGVEIAARRNAHRMTQDLLAGAAGVSRSTVQRAEKGLPISHENARAIYAVLQMGPVVQAPPATEPHFVGGRVNIQVRKPASQPRFANSRANAIGTVAIGMVMALSSVLVAGPYVQAGMLKIGHPSQWVQNWSEVLLAVFLATLVLALPFAMMSDEKRVLAGDDRRAESFEMLAAVSMTMSGLLLFACTIVPMLIATR